MASAQSPAESVGCPGCGERLVFHAEQGGRRAQCNGCGHEFRLPVSERTPTVGFSCQLCGTRLTALAYQVGRKLECPDCGTRTVVPKPPAAAQRQLPAAMSGAQYELWGVDEAPLPAELIRRQRPHHPVPCHLCGTVMYALTEQLGKKFVCPDCGAKTQATANPQAPPPMRELLGEEYELDEASAPTPRPVVVPIAIREAEKHEQARAKGGEKELRRQRKETRNKPPRVPLVQRVLPMLFTSPVLVRWLTLSMILLVVVFFAAPALSPTSGAYSGFYAVCFLAVAVILGALWFAATSAVWLALVTESADGHDRLHDPPSTNILEWVNETAYFAVAITTSLLPGWAIATGLAALDVTNANLAIPAGWLVFFPFALLSALEQGSPMAVFSPKLARSTFRCLPAWLLFYVETFALAAGAGAAAVWLSGKTPLLAVLAGPLIMAAAFLYFRLLGRLAWWLGEWTAESVE